MIEYLKEDNTIKFFTNEMKKSGKTMIMKQYFNNTIECTHLTGDIYDKINELVAAVNKLSKLIDTRK